MPVRQTIPDDEGGTYYFDEEAAEAAAQFFPRFLQHFKGEWAGQPFELSPWQERIVRDVFGWKNKDGSRRYQVVYIWVPRKNGKSTLAGGFALILLMGDGEPGSEVYLIARTESQARIVFSFISQMVSRSEELSSILTPFKTSIWCDALAGKIEPLTGKAEGKHGLNANGVIGDEIHEWADDDLYTFIHQSEGTRRQPMDVLISTAGKRDGVGWDHYQLSEAILEGEVYAPDTYVFIAGADAQMDQDDPNYWTLEETMADANPNYGISVKPEKMKSEVEKAKQNPRKENDVKRYYLNLWVDQEVRWLNMARWDACGHKGEKPSAEPPEKCPIIYRNANWRWREMAKANEGRRCMIGVDLSSTVDLTAAVAVFPPDSTNPLWTVVPRLYLPETDEEHLKARKKNDKFDYLAARDIGALLLTPGDVVDYDFIREDILTMCERYRVEAIGIDRWNSTGMATKLEEQGQTVELFGQGYASMSGPTKFLERIMLQGRLDHGGHPVLRWNARNAAVQKDGAENMKPVKDKSTGRIDGVVATIIGIGVSDDYLEDKGSVYDQEGVRF